MEILIRVGNIIKNMVRIARGKGNKFNMLLFSRKFIMVVN